MKYAYIPKRGPLAAKAAYFGLLPDPRRPKALIILNF
jgi:hypothetical protein